MNEAHFSKEVIDSLKSYDAWAYKIPDIPVSQTFGMQFTPKKPYDINGCYNGRFFAIECKMIKEFKAFGTKALRPNQKDALDDVLEAGGRAFVFLNIRINSPRVNRLLIFDWLLFREQINSFKKKDLENFDYIQGGKGKYDMWDFLNNLDSTTYTLHCVH